MDEMARRVSSTAIAGFLFWLLKPKEETYSRQKNSLLIILARLRGRHRGTGPIGAETTWLNQGHFDTKWCNLLQQDFREALKRPF